MSWQSFVNSLLARSAASGQRKTNRNQLKLSVEGLEKRELLATILTPPLHYDFGTTTSPVASGYTGVSLLAYTSTLGYGWQSLSGLSAVNRGTSNPLTTDFIKGSDGTFLVNLPNDTYSVTPTLGDVKGSMGGVSIYAQGQQVAHGLSTNYAQIKTPTYTVQLNNGQLQLEFKAQSGHGSYFALDALDIVLAPGAPPTANAGPSQTVNEGSAVTFAGAAAGTSSLTYLWNFGDGVTASGTLTPTHTYAGNGNFTVTLTVTDAKNQTAQASTTVTVNNLPPTGNPGGPYTGDAGSAVAFAATATDPGAGDTAAGFTFAWNFGDGATASGASPSHAYAAVGTYTVTLTTTDASGGSSTATATTTVNAAPTANAGSSQTVNEGTAVSYAGTASGGTSTLTYLWNFGDGTTASGSLTPTHTYAGNGTFNVTLTVTDTLNVSAQSSTTVTVINLPPTGNPGGPYTSDAGLAVGFTATATDPGAADTAAGFTYAWDFGDGATASGASPSHAYAAVGNYTVTLTTTDASGGSSTATTTATVNTDPTANAGPGQTVNEGTAVTYAGTASGGTSTLTYLWNFGDGTTASGSLTPMHTYAGNGTFNVTLTVSDTVGGSAASSTTVTVVNLPPTGNPGGPYTSDAGLAIGLTATATDPGAADTAAGFTYAWDFGDGATASGASPSHTYAAAGNYTVTLTTTDASGGSSTATTTATINTDPTVNAGTSQTVNEGAAVTFAGTASGGTSTLTYLWNFGDGTTASGSLTPTHTYAAGKGTFNVTLTVSDTVGGSAASSTTVTVVNLPPTGNPGGPYTSDAGLAIGFTATATDPGAADTAAGFTYAWDFGDGATASGASPSHAYAAAGNYTVTLTTTDASGGSSQATTTATVNTDPSANAGPSQTVNEGTAVTYAGTASGGTSTLTYLWNFGDGITASGSLSPKHTYAGNGTFNVTLTVSDTVGGSAQSSTTVTVNNLPPTGNPGGPYTGDAGNAIAFAATATDPGAADTAAGFTYAWNFGDGATASGASPSHAYAAVGTYTVTLTTTDASGGSSQATATATVNTDPSANAGTSQTVNEGSAVKFAGTASGGTSTLTYLWNFGDGTTASGSLTPTHTYAGNGTFNVTLTVTDTLNVSAQSSTTVTVNNLPPTGNPGGPYSGHAGSPIVFTGTATDPGAADTAAGFTYNWNFGDGSTASGAKPSHTYSAVGTYTVTLTVTDASGGKSSSKTTATVGSAVFVPITGVYGLYTPDKALPAGVKSNPNVDGIAVRATWDYIEPTQGSYNWAYLDSVINAAVAAGKKVSLSIAAGVRTPAWVYAAGAQAFTFVDNTSPLTQTLPVPWDPVFLTQWTNFITQLGNRYAATPQLTQVKITGINYASSETMLPYSTGVQVTVGTNTWTTTNDVADWVAVGYTRTKVENAWQTIADTFSQAFPRQQISAILVPNHFPPIDNNGNVFTDLNGADNQIVSDLLNLGIARYGSQLGVENDGLSDFWIMPQITGVQDQVTTGYQMLWQVTGDPTFRMNNGTSIAITTELQNAVNAAVAAHARFLEIYSSDVLNSALQGVLANAHMALANNNLPLGMITGLPAPGSVLEGNNTFTLGSALADPTTTDPSGFTYAWTVQHNSQTVTTGTASSLTFSANDWGDYAVSLKVTDPSGVASFVNTQTISIVNVAPTITQYNVPLSISTGVSTTFTAAATDPGAADMAAGLTFSWRLGNGSTATGTSVTTTYNGAGTDNVYLTVTDAGGSSATMTSSIVVSRPTHSPEGAAITLSASSLPAPTGASFSGASYAWTVTKNGSTYATGSAANFTFTPNDLSSYLVTLTVTSAAGQSWTNISQYTIDNLAPTFTNVSIPATATKGTAIHVSATATDPGAADMAAGLTYSWKFDDGTTATGATVTHTYTFKGTFTVYVTVADQEGAKTTYSSVIVVS
jgi:PKD repeat protein